MKILTIDIGTGTQDIFLYDPNVHIENGYKMVVVSPTMIVRRQIQKATRNKQAILIHGEMMGGGPSGWAVEDHVRAGLKTYATPLAAKTLNDDLDKVSRSGIEIVSDDEAASLPGSVERVRFRDLDLTAIHKAFAQFGVDLSDLATVAVGVFDHGDAPPGVSDRKFRFDYLNERIKLSNSLSTFAFNAEDIPSEMTRLRTVANARAEFDLPMVVMDTAPAAIYGACFDPNVGFNSKRILVNIGNFHTLAIRMNENKIDGMFEHHTGEIDLPRLEHLLNALADGSLTNEEVFDDMGHGALMLSKEKLVFGDQDHDIVVTGPRRSMIARDASIRPYFAAPYGDMMIAGCFGLLAAVAEKLPELAPAITRSMTAEGFGKPPWEN